MAIQYGSGNIIRNGLIGGRAILRLWDRVEEALFIVYKRTRMPTYDMSGEPYQPRSARDLLDCLYPIKDVLICFPPNELNLFARRELKPHLPEDLIREYGIYFTERKPSKNVHRVELESSRRPAVDQRWNDVAALVASWPPGDRTWTKFRSDRKIKALLGGQLPTDRTIKEQLRKRDTSLQK